MLESKPNGIDRDGVLPPDDGAWSMFCRWSSCPHSPPVVAQFFPPDSTLDLNQLPPDIRQMGGAEIAPVSFQGQLLFEVASPSVVDRENPGETLPVEIRANRIKNDLDYVVSFTNPDLVPADRDYRTTYDPDSFSVQVNMLNGQTVITASDAYRDVPQVLATITATDAEYYGLSQSALAELWRDRIQTALSQALQERSPQALKAWILLAVAVVVGLLTLNVAAWKLHRRLTQAKSQIDQQLTNTAAVSAGPEPTVGEAVPAAPAGKPNPIPSPPPIRPYPHTDWDDLLTALNFGRWLLVWLLVLAWVVAIAFLISHYPLAQITAWEVLLKPQLILLVWFIAGLGNRSLNVVISRAVTFWQTGSIVSSEELQRRQQRISTTVNVIAGLKTVIIYVLAIFFTLNILGLNTNSLLAFGALLGLAISLAAQHIIKELVNGFLVLVEDQYAICDVIEIDEDTSGLVENLNLRVTQLRDGEGRLITLPNSQISRIVNLTRLWARVDESVFIDASADIRAAIAIVESTAQSLYTDARFRSIIVEPPTILGIEEMTHAGIEIRTQIKTKPSEQWGLAREFRLRLKTALDEKGIALGRPQRDVWHHRTHWEDAR